MRPCLWYVHPEDGKPCLVTAKFEDLSWSNCIVDALDVMPDLNLFLTVETTDIWGPEASEVGKYDELWVYEREDGSRWNAGVGSWVTEESNDFTSWLTDELAYWFMEKCESLPKNGKWININES